MSDRNASDDANNIGRPNKVLQVKPPHIRREGGPPTYQGRAGGALVVGGGEVCHWNIILPQVSWSASSRERFSFASGWNRAAATTSIANWSASRSPQETNRSVENA